MNKTTASLIGYYLAFVSIGLVVASLGPTLPGLMAQTGTTVGQISWLLAARPVGYLAGSLVAGRLYDRVPGHPVMALAVLLLSVGLALIPTTPLLTILIVIMLAIGIGEAGTDVGGNTLIVWLYGEKVGPYMNGLHFAFGLGAFIAPLVVAWAVAWSGGIASAYWVLAALALPAAAWTIFAPSPVRRTTTHATERRPLDYRLVILIAVFLLIYVGAEVSFGAWVYTYASALGLADKSMAAYLTSAFWGALTAGRLLSIPLATQFRPRAILATSLLGCLIGVGLPLFISGSVTAIWAGAILSGLSMAAIFPTTLTFAERRLAITGRITSFFFVGASLGGMFWPWLIGQLFERVGAWATMATIFGDLLIGVAVFGAMMALAPKPVQTPA
ncbi:MAG TPA: MFS transporter [Anaerolineales bacterium]|nr:MFS transporter [Anaerolineales bacterium]